MSNFMNNSTNKTQITSTTTVNNSQPLKTEYSFPKISDEVSKYWNDLLEKKKMIENDIANLERMFNIYHSNDIFFQAKEVLIEEKQTVKKQMDQLEEQMFLLKRNCFASFN